MESSNTIDEPLCNKHREFNKQVQNAIVSQTPLEEKEFTKSDNDLANFLKIDIASHNKNIDFILSVLKSDDMLYISRAIKQSPWLVDDQYANIINPEFLNKHLFPNMKTKASIKLLKHIRHYLKNESRFEEFYKNETNDKAAAKWLSRCSIPFIEINVSKHMKHITNLEFKRLCARSVTVFEVAIKNNDMRDTLKAALFLLHTHMDKYLDEFENSRQYGRPRFGPRATELIMKKHPDRIINNFRGYVKSIHIPTFAKHIKREDIMNFLFKLAKDETVEDCYGTVLSDFKTMKHLVKRMPKEEQMEFVKKFVLDKENMKNETIQPGTDLYARKIMCMAIERTDRYRWYEFAPYNIAFDELKILIETEQNIHKKYKMYHVLLTCAAENTKNVIDFVIYYSKNHMKEDIDNVAKTELINKLILMAEIYSKDQETWDTVAGIIDRMNIYAEDDNQIYIQATILHHILQNKQVTKAIEARFSFDTLINYRKKLNQDDQNKVFEYVYNYIKTKVKNDCIETEVGFKSAITLLEQLLHALLVWEKELTDFPFALEKIKDLIRIRKDNSWKIDMSSLYNKKKSWKRLMFEESVVLNPSQKVLVNALKHDPGLLARYRTDVDVMCCDDAISLKQLLRKIRIYWPDSLANNWSKSYLDRLDTVGGHKALTRGLCTLLSHEPFLDIVKKYAPVEPKIDWSNTNELTLGLQRCFAKNMHIARPQPSADIILLYAKGDFLQYALPSLLAMYYDMGYIESQEHIPKLLNAPVSLQKHGLRFAFSKLKHNEIKFHLCKIWQASKNISIRAVTFVLLFDLMCKEKDVAKAAELWEILEVFIDNLSYKEDKKIYEKLPKVDNVPAAIKPKFLVKSYNFLKALLPHLKNDHGSYVAAISRLAYYTTNIMESMSPEFVENIITEHLDFCNESIESNMLHITSCYLLCAKDEQTQNDKYEKLLAPLLKRALIQWNDINNNKYCVRANVQNFLKRLYCDLENYVVKHKMILPTKMFQKIQKVLEAALPVPQNYIILRMWQLVVKVTEITEKNLESDDWEQISTKMVPELGTYCLEVLKEDVKAYFPCIYVLFQKVLRMSLQNSFVALQIYEVLLRDTEFIQAYLLVLDMLPYYGANHYYDENDKNIIKQMEIREFIHKHSSVEVKMHYYCKFGDRDIIMKE